MSEPESNPELLAQLIDEWQERLRRGERPDVEEYAQKYPALAEEIRQLLPGLAALENLKGDALNQTVAPAVSRPVSEGAPVLERLGDFRILREVGRGGMGVVYEAEQVSLGRRVALKLLPQKVILDSRQKRRFEREAKAAAKLHHTNIVPVFGVGEYEGMPYYVMQFIQGLGLDAVVEEIRQMQKNPAQKPVDAQALTVTRRDISAAEVARSLVTGEFHGEDESESDSDPTPTRSTPKPPSTPSSSTTLGSGTFVASTPSIAIAGHDVGRTRSKRQTYWQSIATIGAQVADALEHAHSQGILHRDIKPSNLLLDTRGTVWVTDFGLAKAADHQDDITHTGDILGTLRYMPPEAFEGKNDARGDIYALGLTLYELLALRPAFGEKDRHLLIKQVTTSEPEPLSRLNPAIPRDLATIVQKSIDREPARRYQTARELADDLERFLANEPIQARQTGLWERAVRWVRKKPAAAALVGVSAVASVAVAAAIAVLLYSSRLQDAKLAADQSRTEAEQARDAEVVQRQKAEEAKVEALKQRELADQARAEAEKLRATAETGRENAVRYSDELLLQRGLLAIHTQQWLEAVKDLGAYTKSHPDVLPAWLGFAKAQARVGRTQEAIAAYSKVIDLAKPGTDLNSLLEGYYGRAEQQSARGKYSEAVADFEKAFKLKPIQPNQTAAFARLLYEASVNWRVLAPERLTIKSGTLRVLPDGSIIPDGNYLESDTFTIETTTDLTGIRAFRLEFIASGREVEFDRDGKPVNPNHPPANFVLSEFTVTVTEPKKAPAQVVFKRAWSDYSNPFVYQYDFNMRQIGNVSAAIDGNPKTGWSVTQTLRPPIAVFIASQPITIPVGAKLTIQLRFPGNSAVYRPNSTGRFRLAASPSSPEPSYECAILTSTLTGWMKLAAARYQRGESALALEAIKRVESEAGDQIAKQLLRSIVYDQLDQKTDALAAFDRANELLRTNSRNYNPNASDNTLRWLLIEAASQWIRREPENPAFRRTRAESLVAIEDWAVAIEDYDQLIQSDQTDHRLLFDRGECHARLGQLDKARADFTAAGRLNAQDTFALLHQKVSNLGNIDPPTVLVYLDCALSVEKGNPTEADFLARRGHIYLQLGRRDEAATDIGRALELNPKCAEALLDRGGMRVDVGEREKALADFTEARKINKTAAMNWHTDRLNMKMYEYASTAGPPNTELALLHLGEVIECDSQPFVRAQNMFRRSNVLRNANRWAEAAANITPMIELSPTLSFYLLERAECYVQAGERTRAIADFTEAMKRERDTSLQSIRNKLQIYQRNHNWQQEVIYLDACLSLRHPARDEVEFLRLRASVRLELGQLAPSLADCERILKLVPEDKEATCLQARCLLLHAEALQFEGKPADAAANRRKGREILEKLLKLQPNNEVVASALADCLLSEVAQWQVLDPIKMKSAGGATLSRQPDGSVLATGNNPPLDTYLVGCRTTSAGIRAFRLEAMLDPSLPLSGPGRATNGNFVIGEFVVRSSLSPKEPIVLDRVFASAETRGNGYFYPLRDTIDGKRFTSWGILPQSGQARAIGFMQTATFTLKEPHSARAEGTELIFSMEFGTPQSPDRNLGRFRLAFSTSERAMQAEQIRRSTAHAQIKLVAARLMVGEREAALETLQRVEGKVGIAFPTLILIAWVRETLTPGEPARAAREKFVSFLKKSNDTIQLEIPSIACQVLEKQEDRSPVILHWLARTLDHLGDTKGAIANHDRAIEELPDEVREHYLARGRIFLRLAEWKRAAADFQKAIELKPDDHWLWFTTAPLILWSGDEDGYRRHREEMLKRFGDTKEAAIAERTSKVCALREVDSEMGKQLVSLGQRAVSGESKNQYSAWFRYSLALATYRAGDMEATVKHTQQALDANLTFKSPFVESASRLVQALARHKLGDADNASKLLEQAGVIIAQELPDIDQTHPDNAFHDLLMCLILNEEARKIIEPYAKPRAPAPRALHSLEVGLGSVK